MIKDLYDLMRQSQSGFKIDQTEEEAFGFHTVTILPDETIMENLPKIDCEIDLLTPRLGEDRLEEYIIRRHLLAIARGKNPEAKKKAREILEQVYSLKLIP